MPAHTVMSPAVQMDLAHLNSMNPHGITPEMIGAASKEYVDAAIKSAFVSGKTTVNLSVNINTASQTRLMKLKGIGRRTANRIIAMRQKAPFLNLRGLERVPYLHRDTIEELEPFITFETP